MNMPSILCRFAVTIACAGAGTPPHLPSGWLYLEEEGIDSVRGAYHDRVSDLLVRMEADHWGESIEPWSVAAAQEDRSVVSVRRQGRYVLTEVMRRMDTNCRDRVFTFRCDSTSNSSWNLSANVCSSRDDSRLDALVSALVESDWPTFTGAKDFDLSQLAELKGAHWSDVRRRLGRGGLIERPLDGGFTVSYAHGSLRARLFFGREQRLLRWTVFSNRG
jgi:hypothetical protein